MLIRRYQRLPCHTSWAWALSAILGIGGSFATMLRADETQPTPEALQFFEQRVHPILATRCYECHGAEAQESGLRLDSREAILRGGDSGEPAAVMGQADKSLLIRVVRHQGEVHMPPDFKLPAAEVEVLARWVELGVPWTAGAKPIGAMSLAERAEEARRTHWAFQPVRRPRFPDVTNADWPLTGVDYFVLAGLETAGLAPSPAADRRTLIRRLYFDLLGLPPDPSEVAAFEQDHSADAYARLVDRLLASPQYGARWGRHWLDVARYADTRGYAFAQERRYPYAYTYRDYVISAWNEDKPYDQFIVEQLAADQLPLSDDKSVLAAMGLLTTGRRFNNRHDDLDDQIDVVSRGLLGLTVACARCHDHKFDAIPTEDYYSLYGVFASSREPDELPLIATDVTQIAGYDAFQKELEKRKAELQTFRDEKHAEAVKDAREMVTEYLRRIIASQPGSDAGKLPFLSLHPGELRPRLLDRWRDYLQRRAKPDDVVFGPWSVLAPLPDASFSERAADALARWLPTSPAGATAGGAAPTQKLHPAILEGLVAGPLTNRDDVAQVYGKAFGAALAAWQAAGGDEAAFDKLPSDDRMLAEIIAGKDSPTSIPKDDLRNYLNRAERNKDRELDKKVESFQASSPAAPPRAMVLVDEPQPQDARVLVRGNPGRPGEVVPRQFLSVLAGPERQPFLNGSGRLDLARDIAHPDNPLTRRVVANRVWMHHMGQSLVRTPSDFGIRCEPPTHPELLDYLASRLLDDAWSLKELHREIVLSSTYQQDSRLPDVTTAGVNPTAIDPENRLFWRMNRQRLEFEPLRDSLLAVADRLDVRMGGRPVELTQVPYPRRRTVYGFIDRQDLPNLLRVFDFASPDQSQAARPRTTVPQQALFLMNSEFVADQARALAGRLPEGEANVSGRITALYQLVFQRDPTVDEMKVGRQFLAKLREDPESTKQLGAWAQYAHLLLLTNEFAYVD